MSMQREIIYSTKNLINEIKTLSTLSDLHVKTISYQRLVNNFGKQFAGDFKYPKLSRVLNSLQGNIQSYCDKALEGLHDIQKVEASLLISPMTSKLLARSNSINSLQQYTDFIEEYNRVLSEVYDKYPDSVSLSFITDKEKVSINANVVQEMNGTLSQLSYELNSTIAELQNKWV